MRRPRLTDVFRTPAAAGIGLPKARAITAATALLAALAGASALVGLASPAAGAGPGSPNILFIVTDDQRDGTVLPGIMPNTIQRFQQQGRNFPQGYAVTPLCCPSRSAIFTGRYPHGTDVQTNLDGRRLDQSTTLQHYLHGDGYRTGVFGKYLNDWVGLSLGVPVDHSKPPENPPHFDQWAVFDNGAYYPTQTNPPQCPNPSIQEGVDCVNEQGTLRRLPAGTYATTYLADQAEQFIENAETLNDAQPWFLYVAPTAPHGGTGGTFETSQVVETRYQGPDTVIPPFSPTPGYNETDLSDKPPYVQSTDAAANRASAPQQRDSQLRMLKSVDDLVQRVFAKMDAHGETGDTLAFYISDNGYLWGEHGQLRKGQPYRETVEIPLMMRYPPLVAAGTDGRIVTNADLAPTALAAAGITVPPDAPALDGRSLLDASWTRDRLFTEAWRPCTEAGRPPICSRNDIFPNWASLQTSSYHYVKYMDDPGTPQNEDFHERYDLPGDTDELVNRYGGNGMRDAGEPEPPAAQLEADRRCSGHGPAGLEPPPCP